MPAIVLTIIGLVTSGFSRLIATRIGQWAIELMLFFGIQMAVTHFAMAPIKAGVASAFSGMTADVIAWIGFLNVDRAITIILSAYATVSLTRMALTKKAVS